MFPLCIPWGSWARRPSAPPPTATDTATTCVHDTDTLDCTRTCTPIPYGVPLGAYPYPYEVYGPLPFSSNPCAPWEQLGTKAIAHHRTSPVHTPVYNIPQSHGAHGFAVPLTVPLRVPLRVYTCDFRNLPEMGKTRRMPSNFQK